MKKFILILAFLGLTIGANAQSQKMKERTTAITEYVANVMKLDNVKKAFLYESLLNGSETVRVNLKKVTDKEAKKAVHKQGRDDLEKTLAEKFSKKEIKEIDNLVKKYKKQIQMNK